MKLRSTILLGVLGLLFVLLTATSVVLSIVLERDARGRIIAGLDRAEVVFADLHALRQSLYRAEALTVAQEPRLKAVLGTSDIDRATIVDVAAEMQKVSGADLFLLTDAAGRLVVDTADQAVQDAELGGQPLVRAALADGEAAGVWTQDQRVFQVHASRLAFGDDIVGALVLGHLLDERVVRTVQRQTGIDVVLALDRVAIDHSLTDPALAAAVASIAGELGDDVQERALPGGRYLVRRTSLPGYTGERALAALFIESLDAALATSRALTRWIYVLAAVALVLAAGLAWAIARRLSAPVVQLVDFTRRISAGELEARMPLHGPVEVQALAVAMNRMAGELATARGDLAAKERLERELEIAARIQTSILPRELAAPGVEIDARMRPASEVGGDYYDVLPVADGCWLGIGDVAGHGLTAGLVMLMVQSLVALLVQERPDARPSELLPALNAMLYKNIRGRLAQDEHVTFTLLRVLVDGRVLFAGAHEDIVVCRAAGGPCERVETPGTWLGVVPELDRSLPDATLRLAPGDLMLLYTDGVTEARSARQEQLGMDRLCAALESVRARPVREICDHLLGVVAGWTAVQRDDVTLVVVRYTGS